MINIAYYHFWCLKWSMKPLTKLPSSELKHWKRISEKVEWKLYAHDFLLASYVILSSSSLNNQLEISVKVICLIPQIKGWSEKV